MTKLSIVPVIVAGTLALSLAAETVGFNDAKPGQRHTLRVEFKDIHFRVIHDGKHVFDAQYDTVSDAGTAGVWTKADSVTLFDDFSYGTGN